MQLRELDVFAFRSSRRFRVMLGDGVFDMDLTDHLHCLSRLIRIKL